MTRKSTTYLFVSLAFLAPGGSVDAALTCHQSEESPPHFAVSYSDTDEYSRFEFVPQNPSEHWIGVVFEFFATAPANTLVKDLSPSDRGQTLSERFTASFRAHLNEAVPYDIMSPPRFHDLSGRFVSTFETAIGEHRDLLAIYGQWDAGDFQFFRTMVTVEDNYEKSEKIALQALKEMIRNCLSYDGA